ncbi:hypothetical protein [Falsirhodobacter deserti]|uniref:hypothetical protein n=1 Tax=Falsirhodobacter deserti TaxID=1365611 RepID=UPI0013E2BEC3|nr:hypothetical protein [Falsirhodobacter deserti]
MHSSINLSQTLYAALRSDYLNHQKTVHFGAMSRDLPDIAKLAAKATTEPQKERTNGE